MTYEDVTPNPEINKTKQMSDPNFLVITGLSDTVTDTDALFAGTNPKEKLFPLVNNVPQVSPPMC